MNNLWDAVVYAAAHDLLYAEVAIFCYTVIFALIAFRLGQRYLRRKPPQGIRVRLTTLLMGLVALVAVPTSVQLALSGAPTTDRLITATYAYATQSPDTAAIYIDALEQVRPDDSHGTLTRARQKVAVRQAMAQVSESQQPQSKDLFARSHVRESKAPVSADSRCRIASLLVGRDQARTSVACEGAS